MLKYTFPHGVCKPKITTSISNKWRIPKTPVGNREHVFTIPYKWETFHASGATTAMPHAEMHSRQSYTTNPNAHPMLTWQTIATPSNNNYQMQACTKPQQSLDNCILLTNDRVSLPCLGFRWAQNLELLGSRARAKPTPAKCKHTHTHTQPPRHNIYTRPPYHEQPLLLAFV